MLNLEKLYNIQSPILLLGETGTGKSVIAKKIHQKSKNPNRKFIHLNLATIREDLLESELFGHLRGAFTSALCDKKGYFEAVQNGTLFLDEISELSLEAQKKLLLVLEEKRFYPVGSCQEKIFRGRIIAASNKDLKRLSDRGFFRQDLFFRLSVFCYKLAPLRKDRKKMHFLWQYYFHSYKKKFNKMNIKFSDQVLKFISHYKWPGNVRELKNFMEYTINVADKIIQMNHLPLWFSEDNNSIESKEELNDYSLLTNNEQVSSYENAKLNFEKDYFTDALATFHGNVLLTAKKIKISKTTLATKVKKYRINIYQMRADINDEYKDQFKMIKNQKTITHNLTLM